MIYKAEEAYWQQRWGERWIVQGDCKTAYFHAVANRRRSVLSFL